MLDHDYYAGLGLGRVYEKVLASERLSLEDGEALFACPDITAVGALAHHVRTRMHGNRTFYILNRHVNYTNVCVNRCRFCAFSRPPEQADHDSAFTLTKDQILEKLAQGGLPFSEVHIVGGCHPDLGLDYFLDVIRAVKAAHPAITVKAFTAVEIAHFARLQGMSIRDVLTELKQAGLAMLPGGGAEIFAPEVRDKICPEKLSGQGWLEVAGQAHELGIPGNCTMLFGHVETHRQRLEHLDMLRKQQDATSGFVCFIPLPFLTAHSALKLPPDKKGPHRGLDELRTIAISRLMLDNIPHIKAYWVMLSMKQAQTALYFGADDLDGTVLEEKIGHMAGAESDQGVTLAELRSMIRNAGFQPMQRDSLFNPIQAISTDITKEQSPC